MNKKLIAAMLASAAALAACTACSGSSGAQDSAQSSAAETSAAETTTAATAATVATQTTEPIQFEKAVVQQPGEAALYITDEQVYVQYWGKDTDLLTYDAGVAKIDGNGQYTVSVNVGTKGAQYDISQGQTTEGYVCNGVGFMGIIIKDGETLMPNAIITVDKITVDGKEVSLIAKNYTSTEDGHIRTNINNPYIQNPSGDARSTEGSLYTDNDTSKPALADAADYSPHIINKDDFKTWSKIEVTFTVSGLDGEAVTTDLTTDGASAAETTTAAE
jgi:hypothetical protein